MINYILALLPSFINIPIRKLMGAEIGKGARIRFGSVIKTKKLVLKENVTIGPICYLKGESIFIDKYSKIRPITVVSAQKIVIGQYVHIAPTAIITGDHTPKSEFIIGDHSRISPFCWIDSGEGVRIGKHVGIGGHTLIFTHGAWHDYLSGGTMAHKAVEIKDNVWIPWRVFVMPGVKIGKGSTIMANSYVTKSIPENVIAGGSPAKVLMENALADINSNEKTNRIKQIFSDYVEYSKGEWSAINNGIESTKYAIKYEVDEFPSDNKCLFFLLEEDEQIIDQLKNQKASYIIHSHLKYYYNKPEKTFDRFIFFLRRYGIRLYSIKY
jgi:maltose O-acetyltransferase